MWHFYYIFFILSQIELEKFLFTSETLGQLVNMLIRDDKYFCHKTYSLQLLTQL